MTASEKPTLLFITTELPWPATSGGKIKTFRLVAFLSKHYRVRLLCAYGGDKPADLRAIRQHCEIESVQVFDNHRPRTALNYIKALMSFPTLNSFRVFSRPLESMMRIAIQAADVVIIDHLEMLEMVEDKMLAKVIYHSHNAEFKIWRDFAKLESTIARPLLNLEASRVWNFERWICKKVKFTFAAPNDSALLMAEHKMSADRFRLTYHLGNDAFLNLPAIDLSKNPKRVFYAGTLSWKPNEDGMIWFLKKCWPKVITKHSDAVLVVCGGGASGTLKYNMDQAQNVNYKGFVDNLNAEMEQCRAAIVPLRFGSGMKIKTFDALYRGLPLVTTTTGAEGIDLELICTDESNAFAERLIHLIENRAEAQSEANMLREKLKAKYTYEHIFKQMSADIQSS